jgi:tetratricopeptide (TPR) repeat protein
MSSFKKYVSDLNAEKPEIRQNAARVLGITADPRAVEPLINALEDSVWFVRLYVVMSLGILADPRALGPLVKELKDDNGNVRWAAASALGNFGGMAVEPLSNALNHEDDFVRRYAAEALGEIRDPRAFEPLKRALEDKDWDVHKQAELALEKLGKPNASEDKDAGSLGRNHQQIGGMIGYYGFTDWWLGSFTEKERAHIEEVHCPVGASVGGEQQESMLTEGEIRFTSGSATNFLYALATWFNKPEDRYIAFCILEHAEETMGSLSDLALEEGEGSRGRNDKGTSILDAHFMYLGMIRTHYKDRDNIPGALEKAIQACEKQIAIAPQAARAFKVEPGFTNIPGHTGYQQLAIIRDKQGDYVAAIQLCEEAKAQGWAGDWDKRIARYNKKAVT